MTGQEIKTAYANHLPIIYHHIDGSGISDIEYTDIFSISYIIRVETDGSGRRRNTFQMFLTLNDTCGHSQSTVPAKDCDLKNPDDLTDCDFTPEIRLPADLWATFKNQKPILAKICGENVSFPRIRKLEMMLDPDGGIYITCTVGEHFNGHRIPASDITIIT